VRNCVIVDSRSICSQAKALSEVNAAQLVRAG
jgi:hypothetical protein